MSDYNEKLCLKVQKDFEEKLKTAFTRIDRLDNRINWFYILAISTLVVMVVNIVKEAFL